MPADPSAAMAETMPSAPGDWAFRATFMGGFLLAAGLLFPIVPFVLLGSGVLAGSAGAAEVGAWDFTANVLEALGFLAGFVGIAASLRVPRARGFGAATWEFRVVVAGALLLTVGIAVATVAAGYIAPVGSLLFVDVGEIAARALQAAGFILVFAGLAFALDARVHGPWG